MGYDAVANCNIDSQGVSPMAFGHVCSSVKPVHIREIASNMSTISQFFSSLFFLSTSISPFSVHYV